MKRFVRSGWLTIALGCAVVPALQGCFPVVASGFGAGALLVADRRSSGAYIEDESIEWKTSNRIKDRFGSRVHVNATSFNRNVLLTGEVPDEDSRQEAEKLASGVANVRAVTNELQIAGASSLTSRSNDAYITSKVKARFVDANKFSPNHVKVVTENNIVYLMGLVTRKEADEATEIARTTGGAQKVVRVFEYIDEAQARDMDNLPPTRSGGPAK
ncbi:MAG: hypothetical protein RIR70_1792 [Pseudomonadota bacterium]